MTTGPLVPVVASNDAERSRVVLTILEAHGIPAIIDSDLEGGVPGFHEKLPDGWSQVLVPSTMRGMALEVLRKEDPGAPGMASAIAMAMDALDEDDEDDEPGLIALQRGVGAGSPGSHEDTLRFEPDAFDDETEERTELELPDPGPVGPRIALSLSAIALGGALQNLLSVLWGPREVVRRLAMRAPIFDEVHRWVTAGFLHSSPRHFISNAAFGLLFGTVIFGTHGVGAAVLTWVMASAAGMVAEVGLSADPLYVLGASAGNYGLVGLWASGQLQRARASLLPRRERLKTFGILLLLVPGALTPISSSGTRIAVIAHAFGFLVGYLAGFGFERRLHPEAFVRIHTRSQVAGVLAVSLVATAWLLGLAL